MPVLLTAWSLLKNVGFLVSSSRAIGHVVSEMVKDKKKFPDCTQASLVIDILETALRKKVVDLPNVDEDAVADWLETQKKEILQCQTPTLLTKSS